MPDENAVRDALTNHRFCYMVELVASRLSREAKLLHVAADLAQIPQLVAGSVTSYAGGAMGHDPIRVGTAARARGLTPNIHITCANRSTIDIRRDLDDLQALGIENVFAITGDYPQAAAAYTPSGRVPFGGDSVQLVEMISRMRDAGYPFYVSVAVSPFKYTEADCAWQYLKLEKKIAAGADYVITQLGYDALKFRELKRHLEERGITTPVFGNVYVLNAGTAKKMSRGEPPGCWVSPELRDKIQVEAQTPDKGEAARLERAAQMVAIVRGLGYAGAYLGGDHRADHIRWIINRSEALAPRWEELAEELAWTPKNGFYLYQASTKPVKSRGILPGLMDLAGRLFPVNQEGWLRDLLTGVFRQVDKVPAAAQFLERVEFAVKSPMFGCQACGNCVLGQMEYVCPMTCPKGMRNGPCGGTNNGQCEVVPDKPCIWVAVYDRAKAANRLDDLRVYIPRPNPALQGTSSWINYFLDRDNRPGTFEPLVQISSAPTADGTSDSTEEMLAKSHEGGGR